MKKFLRTITNKYLITGTVFLVWMIWFDQNDWFSQQQHSKDLAAVKAKVTFLNVEIAKMEKEHKDLVSNPQMLEKFARENFRMKRDNEDLYIIEKK